MANNALIGALRAEATLESGKFIDGARKLRTAAKTTETQFQKSFGAMGRSVKGFGGAVTAGLSIGIFGALIKKSLDYAGSLAEVAQQVGVTARDLQVLRFAGGQVGISTEQMDKGLQKFTKSLGDARNGSEEAIKVFKALGFTDQDIQKLDVHDALMKTADGIGAIGDRATRASPEVRLFGKAGQQLDTLFSQGSRGINELSAAAEKLGLVLSDEQIQHADETADKLEAVKTVLGAQIAGVVADNAQSILGLASALASLTSSIIKFLGSNPQVALGIIGGLAGARIGGGYGAIAGAIGGIALGERMAVNSRNTNMDLQFRIQAAREASARVHAAEKNPTGIVRGDRGEIIEDRNQTLHRARAEALKEAALLNQAVAIHKAGRVAAKTSNSTLPQFLASDSNRKAPRAPRDRSDDTAFQFDQELKRAHVDVLRAQQSLAVTSDKRAEIALQILDAEKGIQEAELQDRVRRAEQDFAEKKITAGTLEQVKAQADRLRAEYADEAALERKQIADDLAAEKARDAAELVQSGYDIRLEELQNEAALKETAAERREVELRILDLMKEQEKARLEAVIADTQASELAKAQAKQRLDSLDNIYTGRASSVVQGTRGPMEDWLSQLPTTAAKAQEAFERLETQGFDGLIDAAVALTDGFDSAKEALLNTLKQFLQGVLRMQLQQGFGSALQGGIGSFFKGLFGGGGVNSSLSDPGYGFASQGSLVSSGNPFSNLPGFASGGSLLLKGIPGIDRNMISMNGIPIARVSYGEKINISNDNGRGSAMGRRGDINFNLYGLTDGDGFRRNERQITRNARRKLGVQ